MTIESDKNLPQSRTIKRITVTIDVKYESRIVKISRNQFPFSPSTALNVFSVVGTTLDVNTRILYDNSRGTDFGHGYTAISRSPKLFENFSAFFPLTTADFQAYPNAIILNDYIKNWCNKNPKEIFMNMDFWIANDKVNILPRSFSEQSSRELLKNNGFNHLL